MKLVAIYIKEHSFLFNEPQTINLGGEFFYTFNLNAENKLEIIRQKNSSFINDFWGDDIVLLSAIVGENGSGKTSLLKELVVSFDRHRDGTLFNNIACVYEIDENNFKVNTSLDLADDSFKNYDFTKIRIEYYNPVIDYDLRDISGYINPSKIFENNLSEYHLKILEFQVIFNYSEVSKSLKELYGEHFPRFGGMLLRSKLHYKEDFKKIYALSNLQNGMNSFLDKVLSKYPNLNEQNSQFLHFQDDFVKNIEVTILAILAINNTYPEISGLGTRRYSLDEILEGEDFLEILKKYKEQYLSLNSQQYLFDLYSKLPLDNFRKHLKSNKDTLVPQFKNVEKILDIFEAFENFYNELLVIKDKNGFTRYENNLLFSNTANEPTLTENISQFIINYQKLLLQLNRLHVKEPSLIEFSFFKTSSNNRLIFSSGEKALLNLYSIIYNFSLNSEIRTHNWKNFIFLLDESDLGFHPEWKKKYVDSITKVFPEILKKVRNKESIQIIITTHDPLTLSDIPNSNIVYLKKNNYKTQILENIGRPQKSFGANITDLLSDSFFIEDGLIGDFAKAKIQITLEWLKKEANKRGQAFILEKDIILPEFKSKIDEFKHHKKIIELIDEPLVKQKLRGMYLEFIVDDTDYKESEIKRLEIELLKLKS